eukprot:gene35025-45339_t
MLSLRLQRVADTKINGDPVLLEDDSQETGHATLKLEDVTADRFRIEMASKDIELRRALDVEKEYGRKIIGLQTELRFKNNAIIGLKKEFTEMMISLESNIQMLKSSPVIVENGYSVALAMKKRSTRLSNNESNRSKNIAPLVLPAHKTESTKQKTVSSTASAAGASLSSVELKTAAIDSINKRFASYETGRKALEDRIRNLELQLQQRPPEVTYPGNTSSQGSTDYKPIEGIAQLSPVSKNNKVGRSVGFLPSADSSQSTRRDHKYSSKYEHNHVSANKVLHPINQDDLVAQTDSYLKGSLAGPDVSLALIEVPSSSVTKETSSFQLALVSNELNVSHPSSARPAVTSPITASRVFRPPTPHGESLDRSLLKTSSPSSKAAEDIASDTVISIPPSRLHGHTSASLIGNETVPEPLEGNGKEFLRADFYADLEDSIVDATILRIDIANPAYHESIITSPPFSVRPTVASPIVSSRAVKVSTPQSASAEQELNKPSPPSVKGTEQAMLNMELASRDTDSATATKQHKALLKEKKKLKRIIHGRKDFFASSGRDPTREEQELIDEELRRYTQLVQALKRFGDNDAE